MNFLLCCNKQENLGPENKTPLCGICEIAVKAAESLLSNNMTEVCGLLFSDAELAEANYGCSSQLRVCPAAAMGV